MTNNNIVTLLVIALINNLYWAKCSLANPLSRQLILSTGNSHTSFSVRVVRTVEAIQSHRKTLGQFNDTHSIQITSSRPQDHDSNVVDFSKEKLAVIYGCRGTNGQRLGQSLERLIHEDPVEGRLLIASPEDGDISQSIQDQCYIVRIRSFEFDSVKLQNGNINDELTSDNKQFLREFLDKFNSTDRLEYFAKFLTGEHPASPIRTRQAYSAGGMLAAKWIHNYLSILGFECSYFKYSVPRYPFASPHWNPNVVCDWPLHSSSSTIETALVVVGAHYDDRQVNMRSTSDRAPGANDDGSGTALLMELAYQISQSRLSFRHPVRFVAFSGEEQGLYGSEAYAKYCRQNGVQIKAMLQADMVGYNSQMYNRNDSTKHHQHRMAFVKGNVSKRLTDWLKNVIIAEYVPELLVMDTNACCSDHQSFHEQGYEAVGFVEAGGYLIDPEYHKIGDFVQRPGYDLDQIRVIAKAVGASLCQLAGFSTA